jgi:hypothetical protein
MHRLAVKCAERLQKENGKNWGHNRKNQGFQAVSRQKITMYF